MDLQLKQKRALVTGSWRGTGQIIAAHLAREGADVLVHGLEAGQAEQSVAEIGTGTPVTGDIRTDSGALQLTEAAGTVDILINNYGAASPGKWEGTTEAAWLDAYQTNVLSAQRMVSHCLPGMINSGWGRIINLGTVGSTSPAARMPHYYASKGALATLTVSLAKEVARTGVTVNLVSPGLILTPEVQEAYLERGRRKGWGTTWEEVEAHVAADIPTGRIARREEVADLVVFLASDLAGAIHGQNVQIDGGALGIV